MNLAQFTIVGSFKYQVIVSMEPQKKRFLYRKENRHKTAEKMRCAIILARMVLARKETNRLSPNGKDKIWSITAQNWAHT